MIIAVSRCPKGMGVEVRVMREPTGRCRGLCGRVGSPRFRVLAHHGGAGSWAGLVGGRGIDRVLYGRVRPPSWEEGAGPVIEG